MWYVGKSTTPGHEFSYKLRYIVGVALVEMTISTNQKLTIYRNLFENGVHAQGRHFLVFLELLTIHWARGTLGDSALWAEHLLISAVLLISAFLVKTLHGSIFTRTFLPRRLRWWLYRQLIAVLTVRDRLAHSTDFLHLSRIFLSHLQTLFYCFFRLKKIVLQFLRAPFPPFVANIDIGYLCFYFVIIINKIKLYNIKRIHFNMEWNFPISVATLISFRPTIRVSRILSAGIDFRRQDLTSVDMRFWRLMVVDL